MLSPAQQAAIDQARDLIIAHFPPSDHGSYAILIGVVKTDAQKNIQTSVRTHGKNNLKPFVLCSIGETIVADFKASDIPHGT